MEHLIKNTFFYRSGDAYVCSLSLHAGFAVGGSVIPGPSDTDEELQAAALKNAMGELRKIVNFAKNFDEAQGTAKQRVEAELSALNKRLAGLQVFLAKGQPDGMDDISWELLIEQRTHMKGYVEVLVTRLENWGEV